MAKIEPTLIQRSETKPKEWRRCIDDIFSLCDSDKKDVDQFIEQANKFHPTIKFTAEIWENEISFLNTVVFKRESLKNESILDKLTTNLVKPFNIQISTHAIHTAWKMVSLKAKEWDCLELTLQKQHLRRALWSSNNTWRHAAILKQS